MCKEDYTVVAFHTEEYHEIGDTLHLNIFQPEACHIQTNVTLLSNS